MSAKKKIDELLYEVKEKINRDLTIKLENNKYNISIPKYIYPYKIVEDDIYLPFAYGYRELNLVRPPRESFPLTNIDFESELRTEQKIVKKEAINTLSRKGSVLISCHTGFGKCLGYNTPVLMYNGSIKMVQDIEKGDKLMGDDSKLRNVLSICKGQQLMYKIIPKIGNSFSANICHILSLYICCNKSISYSPIKKKHIAKYLDRNKVRFVKTIFEDKIEAKNFLKTINDNNILDISIIDYLKLPNKVKKYLKCFKVAVDFPFINIRYDPYWIGYIFGLEFQETKNNEKFQNIYSIIFEYIPYEYKCNTKDIRLKVLKGFIDANGGYIKGVCRLIVPFEKIASDIVYLAYSVGLKCFEKKIRKKENIYYIIVIYENSLKIYENNISFISNFKIESMNYDDYYGFTIDGNRRFLLGDFTVTHNTILSINIAATIRFKTLIIVNKIVLLKQWEESINNFCPNATVQKISPKSEKMDCDFFLINAINVPKMNECFFVDVGCVIVDECHLIMAETLSRSLQYICPRYLIGLSATPYRPDGLDIMLNLYFGDTKIIRELVRKHIVYVVNTGFTPETELSKTGKINWSVVLDSQANDEQRNNLIVNIIQYFQDRTFLILVKRISQGNYLIEKLREIGENVTSLLGSQQEYDIDARILIGTNSKIGTGFDHSRLDTLLLASDVEEYFIQFLGRIFRRPDVNPIVFDLVDNNPILKRHFSTRRSVYTKMGGIIKNFDITILE